MINKDEVVALVKDSAEKIGGEGAIGKIEAAIGHSIEDAVHNRVLMLNGCGRKIFTLSELFEWSVCSIEETVLDDIDNDVIEKMNPYGKSNIVSFKGNNITKGLK